MSWGASHEHLDNTSILQLLAERFGEPGEVYSSPVDARRQQGIASVSQVLEVGANDTNAREIPLVRSRPAAPSAVRSPLMDAFTKAGMELVSRHGTEALLRYKELAKLVERGPA